jgi:hypothetical protein
MNHVYLNIKGGAQIGCVNASIPFAKLTIDNEKLTIRVFILGNYIFNRSEIISIEQYVLIPFIWWGIKINHINNNYPKKIIFFTFGNPKKIIDSINKIGFIDPYIKNLSNYNKDAKDGIPVNIIPKVGVILLWNLLLILDILNISNKKNFEPGIFSIIAITFVFIITISLKYTHLCKKVILKKGRQYDEIKHINNLLMIVSGCLTLFFLINFITG